MFFQRAKVERNVIHGGRQYPARRTARQVRHQSVAVHHPATVLVDQLAHGDTGGRKLDSWFLHAARYGEASEAGASVAAEALPPIDALLQQVAHPVERFDIVDERRTTEQPDLE